MAQAKNLGGIEVTIGAKSKQWERDLKKAEQQLDKFAKRMDKLASGFEKAGKKLMMGVTAPITALGVASIKTAAEMQAFANNFNQSFREMSDEVRSWAHEFGDAVGRSQLQMETMLSMTQSMVYPMLENREAAAGMSQAITQLAIDLGSFYDVADDEALNALRSALVGNSEPMRRFGVVVMDSTLELEAQRIGLQKNVAQMSEAEKMLLRYVQILRQTSDAHGDAIRNQDEFGNQLKALQADFENLRIELGERLLPIATGLLRWARDLMEALSELDDETITTLINFAVWAASASLVAFTLGKIIRGVVGVSRALQILIKFIAGNWQSVLIGVALGWVLTLDEVQERLERLGRAFGLGGMIDTIEQYSGALGDLMDVASSLEFSTQLDATEYQKFLEDARKSAEEALRQGIADGASKGMGDAWAEFVKEVEATKWEWLTGLRVDTILDTLVKVDPAKWTPETLRDIASFSAEGLHTMDMGLTESQRALVDELALREREIEHYASRIRKLMETALSIDPQWQPTGLDSVSIEIQMLMTYMVQAMQQLNELQQKAQRAEAQAAQRRRLVESVIIPDILSPALPNQLARAYTDYLSREIDEALRGVDIAEVLGDEPIKITDEELRKRLIEAAGVGDLIDQLKTWSEYLARLDLNQALHKLNLQVIGLGSGPLHQVDRLIASITGAEWDRPTVMIDELTRIIREQVATLHNAGKSWFEIQGYIKGNVDWLRDLVAEQKKLNLDRKLQEIRDALTEQLEGGAKFEIERFLADVSGESFDGLEYQLDAVSRALWDQIAVMREAGKSWNEIEQAIAPVLDQYAELATTKWGRDQKRAVKSIRDRLQQTLNTERWVEAAFQGSGFDALQFEADALTRAMRDIATQMMVQGASVDEILAETADLQARLTEVTEQIAERDRYSWLDDQAKQMEDSLSKWVQSAFAIATPAGFLAEVLGHLSSFAERLLSPLAILAEVTAIMLEPAFKALFPIIKGFGILVLNVVTGVSTVWNAIVGTLGGIFGALANISILGRKPLRFLQGVADFFNGLMVDTDSLSDAMQRLRDLTWEQADAAESAAQALHNVPSGFKVALRRFQVAQPVDMPMPTAMATATYTTAATPNTTVSGAQTAGGNVIVIQGDVYGWDDFKRKVAKANGEIRRSNNLSMHGTTVGVTV